MGTLIKDVTIMHGIQEAKQPIVIEDSRRFDMID
jgi:hypothetical protein